MSHLGDGLELGVIERVRAGIGIDIERIDGRLLAGVQRGGAVCRVRNEAWQGKAILGLAIDTWTMCGHASRLTVHAVRHLVSKRLHLVQLQKRSVLSVDGFVGLSPVTCLSALAAEDIYPRHAQEHSQ